MAQVPADYRRGHLAYDAYTGTLNPDTTDSGWPDLPDDEKNAWIVAARAVAMDVEGPF